MTVCVVLKVCRRVFCELRAVLSVVESEMVVVSSGVVVYLRCFGGAADGEMQGVGLKWQGQ